jgi:hypothetical protein
MKPVISLTREDIRDIILICYEASDISDELLDEACSWISKDFDYSNVSELIENILYFRMVDKLKGLPKQGK